MAMTVVDDKKPLMFAIRKFVFASYGVFADIEKKSYSLKKDGQKDAALQIRGVLFYGSRQFRDQLAALLSDIDMVESTYSNQNNSNFQGDLFQHDYDLTAHLVTTWHLCEIFFLNQSNSNSLETVNWLKVRLRHFCHVVLVFDFIYKYIINSI